MANAKVVEAKSTEKGVEINKPAGAEALNKVNVERQAAKEPAPEPTPAPVNEYPDVSAIVPKEVNTPEETIIVGQAKSDKPDVVWVTGTTNDLFRVGPKWVPVQKGKKFQLDVDTAKYLRERNKVSY